MIKLIKIIAAVAVVFFCLNYWFEMNQPSQLRWKKPLYQIEMPAAIPRINSKKELAAVIGVVLGTWYVIKSIFSPY